MAFLRKEGKYYKLYWYQDKKKHKLSTRTGNRSLALQIQRKLEEQFAANKFNIDFIKNQNIKLNNFFEEALAYSQINKSPNTCNREKIVFNNFLAFCGNININRVDIKLIESYKNYKINNFYKPGGINIELRHLSAAFSIAVKYKYIHENPFKMVKKIPVEKKLPIFFTEDQAKLLLEHTRHRNIYQWIMIALHTGCRISEIANLKWSDINLKTKEITIYGKGSKERYIPIPNILVEYFLDIFNTKCKYVISGSLDRKEITRQFRQYADELGFYKHTFHSLRHTYASWLVQRAVPLREVQELLGHESIKTTEIYSHLKKTNLRNAVNKLNGTGIVPVVLKKSAGGGTRTHT